MHQSTNRLRLASTDIALSSFGNGAKKRRESRGEPLHGGEEEAAQRAEGGEETMVAPTPEGESLSKTR